MADIETVDQFDVVQKAKYCHFSVNLLSERLGL